MKYRFSAFLVVMVSIGLTALLAGCVSAPAPSNTTTPWIPPSRAQNPDTIWKDIRAQKADYTNELSLAEALDIALQNNPASRKTWSDARAASAQVDQAKGYFLPTVVGTAGANRQRTTAEPDDFSLDYTKYGPGLQLNYLVINFGGGRQAAVEQALQTVYAANYLFNRSIQDILLAVETAYYGLVSAKAGIEAAEANVKDARTALETAQARKAAGVGTDLEVLQAQASYDQSRYGLVNAKGQFKIARGALAQAMGIPADITIQVVAPTNAVPAAVTPQDMRQLIDDALDRRPDIAALRATLAAKKAAIRVTGSVLWPLLYVNGNVSRNYYDTVTDKEFQQNQQNDWSYGAGATLQWTLFDGFQTLSAKRAAAAQADSAQAQLQQAELAASADVWTRYYAYETALERHTVSIAYLTSASASYDLALDSYKNGLSNIIDLLNAESKLAQARMQYVSARQDAFTALANLAYATGRLEKGGAAQTEGIFSTPARKDQP
ncbi:MAG: TolC family protein [Verrucomicrobia bacterium]|nr:TolC family protein [Verrucomicrobiota bacterium]